MKQTLDVVILKPSKYGPDGYVERFLKGFMPNSTVPYIRSMTPDVVDSVLINTHSIDEYVQTDLAYLDLLKNPATPTLLAVVGAQSHQFQRSLDLAALARESGVQNCVIGGPHAMTCDTSMLQNRGVSFALAEAETIWPTILRDAIRGQLQPVYGAAQRWARELNAPVLIPPSREDLRRYVVPMLGIYPARGCPFTCNFCSVIKIAGRQIRSQSVETTMASLRAAKTAKIRMVAFVSDNANKYAEIEELLEQMIAEQINIPFFVQCDTQISKDENLVRLLGRAGCFQMFVGVESFRRDVLLAAHKTQNHPSQYKNIVRLCRENGITTHFSNIIGFPGQSRQDILDHNRILREIDPDIVSFYILCPIPGTAQYDEFLAEGRITEPNLDRFDATTLTWKHDLSSTELDDLLFESYRRFYSLPHLGATLLRRFGRNKFDSICLQGGAFQIFNRFMGHKHIHPMSGGVWRIRLDSAADYRALRRKHFGYDLVPLPKSLALSATDAELNRRVKSAL